MGPSIAALLQAGERFSAAVAMDTVLQTLAESVFALARARFVAIYRPDGDELVRLFRIPDAPDPLSPARLATAGSAPGWAFAHGQSYRAGDCLAVPVLNPAGSIVAVVFAHDAAGNHRFSAADRRVCEAVARHAAIAYERARLTAELQRTTRALTLLEERARVGMDLHDGAIQALYGVMLNLSAIGRSQAAEPAQTAANLQTTIAQIAGVIEEIRAYISGLWAEELGARGLPAGLRSLACDLQANMRINTTLDLGVDLDAALQPEALASLLQIAREAVSNVIRHAGATAVQIRTEQAGGRLSLWIIDNGIGFQPVATAGRLGSRGLRNMAERARRLGGELHVTSTPGEGTEIRLDLDLRR